MNKPILKTIVDHAEANPAVVTSLFGSAIIEACKERVKCTENPDLKELKRKANAILYLIDEIETHREHIEHKMMLISPNMLQPHEDAIHDEIEMHQRHIDGASYNLTKLLQDVL